MSSLSCPCLGPQVQFHVVVSAFSLSELPSKAERAEVVRTLWRKTSDFLVSWSPFSLQVLKQLHGFHAFPSIHWSLSSFFSPAQNPLSLFYGLHPHIVYNTISFRTTIPTVNVLTKLHLCFHVVQGLCSVSSFVNRYWWRMEQKLGTACSWKPGTSSLR